ncbi:MAG: IS21 family transposase, partial [Oscillospiraceae bacterium]|nr:IS21 family transposase [Oscillospiraceae bacterium]
MTNYREILRLHSLGLNKTEIATSCQCARNTVAATLQRAANCGLQWPLPEEMSDKQLSERLFPSGTSKPVYKMPDYAYVHKELQRSGVTLNLLWLEYCDQCRAAGEVPYQSTQFNKYYADYLAKANATMHLNHKPGEIMQVDWAGDTASVIDTDTGEIIPAYVFVATLPYSGYSYVEAFFSMNQEAWTTAHVNAYKYFGGVTRIIQCDNLKTGVQKHGKDEIVLNKSYQELAEHYGTAILPARVRAPKDKAAVEGTVGIISTFILAALRNRQFLSLLELNDAIGDRLEAFNRKPFQKREGSRASSFAEERPFLRPLPP